MHGYRTRLGLTLIGFATAFELVILAWSAARRGAGEAVVAAVVGSFAYNATMTLGASALARPLRITQPYQLRLPLVVMLAVLVFALLLAWRPKHLTRPAGLLLLLGYRAFVVTVVRAL